MDRLNELPSALVRQARTSLSARQAGRWPYPVRRPEAPPPSPGSSPRPPDFVGVGVQKAGTSWWYGLLADHPAVHRRDPQPKELHFFEEFWREPFTDAEVAAYHRWFARPAGTVAGEWTPRYLYDWWTPPLLAKSAPAARLLVLLRDPVERYLSGLAFDRDRGSGTVAIVSQDAFHRGLYAAQLARLLDHFPAEQLMVLQYERCRDDPAGELARTYTFLGLDAGHRPARLTRHVGPRAAKPDLPDDAYQALREAFRPDLHALFQRFPDLDAALWPTACS